MENEFVLIIDFGSQVTQLIARRLRELNVYCEIHPFNKVNDEFLQKFNPKAIILSGGPASVLNDNAPKPPLSIYDLEIPILGILGTAPFWVSLAVADFLVKLSLVTISLIPIPNNSSFLVLRLLRVFRVLRLISVIPELKQIIEAILQSIKRVFFLSRVLFFLRYIY